MYTETVQKEKSNAATEIAEGDHGGDFGGCLINGGNLQSANIPEPSLPPFLQKIYEIADDPETKSIVSWNSNGTSFIIWDHNKFSENILPKYFKTSVFSSFVYQLNKYGFRKIRRNRFEYANPSIKSSMRFPEVSDDEGSSTVFLKHLKETKDPTSKNGLKKPRLTELKITESEVNNEDKIEISTPKVSSADNLGNSNQATKENAESFEILKRILEDDTWFSIEGDVNHAKAIVELGKMMESYRAMDRGNLEEKASDQEVDDDIPIDSWA